MGGQRRRARRAGRPLTQPGVHGGGRLRHRRRGQGEELLAQEALGHQVPPDAARGRGDPRVVRLQVRGRGAARRVEVEHYLSRAALSTSMLFIYGEIDLSSPPQSLVLCLTQIDRYSRYRLRVCFVLYPHCITKSLSTK